MCYGMGCLWENPWTGECEKPWLEPCPASEEEQDEEEGEDYGGSVPPR